MLRTSLLNNFGGMAQTFLREELEANPIDFERITSDSDYLKELKNANVLLTSCKFSLIDDLSKRSNNYTKLLHILSYIFRFLHNSRNPSVKRSGQLDYSEVNEAELCLIKNLQASAFQEEIEFLAKSSCNSKKRGQENISLQSHGKFVKMEIGDAAIYRSFGEFRRPNSYCHLYGAQGQRQAYF
ncbi:hypothetical protein TNCV_4110111 [Trichonephila clavipes]|nr:hypothetical protein TNCV_4110111 [Trichonephila clavipes]